MVTWESELSQLLEREQALLEGISECESQKTDILAEGDVDSLNKMINREQPLSIQCQAAETRRLALMNKYKLSGKTFREICRLADEEYKNVLEAQHESLSKIANKLKTTNKLNNELTKTRLEFYGRVRSMISRPVYGYDGTVEKQGQGGRSLIDRKI